MNLANLLTCSRMVLAVIFVVFLFSSSPFGNFLALFAFIAAALTDYWDGVVAREMGEVSQFGKLMDPIADKTLTLFAFFGFWYLGLLPFWMVLLVALRDVLVTTARFLVSSDGIRAARGSGKQKTVLQILFIIAVLLYLIARQSPDWQTSWDDHALQFIHGGMFIIVLVTIWSGLRALKPSLFKY